MMRTLCFLLFSFCVCSAIAQTEEPTPIAVLPFVKSAGANVTSVEAVQETVTKEFVERSRFKIVDRTKFESVIKELNIQKSEEFLNSAVVEQGKQAGAQYLVTGVVGNMSVSKTTEQKLIDEKRPTLGTKTVYSYQGYINLSYQVIDVATGVSVYSENISAHSHNFDNGGEGDIMTNALCHLRAEVKKAVMKEFPADLHIVQVEATTKKGLPDKVLIDAGTAMFDEKKSSCGDGMSTFMDDPLKNIFKRGANKVQFNVYELTTVTVNDKEVKRRTKIGEMIMDEVQGDLSVCKVTKGADEIKAGMDGGKKIIVQVQ